MPNAWSNKDERRYSTSRTARSNAARQEDTAEEIAARTVNKRRREEGRTPDRRTSGTGNPNRGLEERSKDELYNRAKQLKIEGRGKMTKPELVEAVRSRQGIGAVT
jgi:hypothetical protein